MKFWQSLIKWAVIALVATSVTFFVTLGLAEGSDQKFATAAFAVFALALTQVVTIFFMDAADVYCLISFFISTLAAWFVFVFTSSSMTGFTFFAGAIVGVVLGFVGLIFIFLAAEEANCTNKISKSKVWIFYIAEIIVIMLPMLGVVYYSTLFRLWEAI